jgi:hypothetical protein
MKNYNSFFLIIPCYLFREFLENGYYPGTQGNSGQISLLFLKNTLYFACYQGIDSRDGFGIDSLHHHLLS